MSRIVRATLIAFPVALWVTIALFGVTGSPQAVLGAADEELKLSSIAPIEELVAEADDLVADLDKVVTSEAEYKKGKKNASRDAYTLAVVAHAIANHDMKGDVKWAENAAFVRDAARSFAGADEFAAAKAALAQAKEIIGGAKPNGAAQQLEWNQVVPLKEIMPVVNRRNLLLGRGVRRPRPSTRPESVRHAVLLAIIGHTIRDDLSALEDQGDAGRWREFSGAMRQEFGKLASLIRDKSDDQLKDARKTATNACSECHKKFRPEVE